MILHHYIKKCVPATLIWILLMVGLMPTLQAQNMSSMGTRFWATFTTNNNEANPGLTLIVSAQNACDVTIVNPNVPAATWSVTQHIDDDGLVQINIPTARAYIPSSEYNRLSNKGLLITSTDTISLYASNYSTNTLSITCVLPEVVLADEYMVQTYPNDNTGNQSHSTFTIIATENNTIIDISPTAQVVTYTTTGMWQTTVNHNPGTTYSVTLNQGQTFEVGTATANADLSGSVVKARDGKKIAVFNGQSCVHIPKSRNFLDQINEQSFPIKTWGKRFAITKTVGQKRNFVRVTAVANGTNLSIRKKTATTTFTINRGQTHEFELLDADTSCYLEASAPVAVYLYLVALQYPSATASVEHNGDPAMVIISPVEQKIKDIIFGVFNTNAIFNYHNFNIVTRTRDVGSVQLNGVDISNQFSPLAGNSGYSFARLSNMQEGNYTLHSEGGITVYVYGLGSHEGYAYSVGSTLMDLSCQMEVNGLSNLDFAKGQEWCINEEFKFKSVVEYTHDSIRWQFSDGLADSVGDSTTHTFTTYGTHYVTMLVRNQKNGLWVYDTLLVAIDVPEKKDSIFTSICPGSQYDFNGTLYNTAGTYYDTLPSGYGCDSVVTLHLSISPANVIDDSITLCSSVFQSGWTYYDTTFDASTVSGIYVLRRADAGGGCNTTITLKLTVNPCYDILDVQAKCSNEFPWTYRDTTFDAGTPNGTYVLRRQTWLGCDSVVTLQLTVNPAYTLPVYDTTVCLNSLPYTFLFSGKNYDPGLVGVYTFYDTIPTANGCNCDSIATLHLTVNPPTPTTYYDTICQGDTVVFNGMSLDVSGIYQDTLCDSIITLHLTVAPNYNLFDTLALCTNQFPYFYGGQTFVEGAVEGDYTFALTTAAGCDSIMHLHLTVHPTYDIDDHLTICSNQLPYPYGDTSFAAGTTSGVYTLRRTTTNGCDSIIHLTLTVNPAYLTPTPDTLLICDQQLPYVYGDTVLGTNMVSGDYSIRLHTAHGCDSVVNLHLTVMPTYDFTDSIAISSQGKQFWVAFMDNYFDNNTTTFSLLMSSTDVSCHGTVQNLATGWSAPFAVNANGLARIEIPKVQAYVDSSQYNIVTQKGLLVTSTAEMSLYASNFMDASFDATCVLPEHALADEYITQSYEFDISGAFLIVATEDNTVVDITPNTATAGGHAAHLPYSVALNKGETYMERGFDNDYSQIVDFSGVHIKARNGAKIAVFNGNPAAYVPGSNESSACSYDYYDPPGSGDLQHCCADHLIEQAFPIKTWGKKFAITQALGQSRNRVRITAMSDQTEIRKNGTVIANINRYQSYEFEITRDEVSCYIETTEPVATYLYFVSTFHSYRYTCNWADLNGDPAMVIITPIEQKIGDITFGMFNTARTQTHNLNIIVDAADTTITLDGADISGHFALLNGNPNFAFARISNVSEGTHTLHSDNGLIAYIYGVGTDESYAYSVGSSAKKTTLQPIINGMRGNQIPPNYEFCKGYDITLQADVSYEPRAITWLVNGDSVACGDSTSYIFDSCGTFKLQMLVERPQITCIGKTYDTTTTTIFIPCKTATVYDTICGGEIYYIHDSTCTYTLSGTYVDTLTSAYGCDSVVTLHLTVHPLYRLPADSIADTICEGQTFMFLFSGKTYTATGIYHDTLHSVNGCDSIGTLNLTVSPPYRLPTDSTIDTICAGQTYTFPFSGKTYNTTGIYHDTLHSIYGCDSIGTLNLTVHPAYRLPTDSVGKDICVGESYTFPFNGKTYTTTGIYHDTLHTVHGCDSIGTLNLTVHPAYRLPADSTTATICAGQTYTFPFSGKTYTTTGIYHDTLPTIHGCDSIGVLVLTVNPIYRLPTDSTNSAICAGDTVYLWGKIFTQSGTYYDTLHTVHGCDSIRTLALTVHPEIEFTVADVVFVCADDEFIPIEHTVYNTYPSTYSIRFEDTQNYFTNIYNAPYMAGNAAPIRMGTPNGLVPGTYNASLQLSTPICNSRQAPFSITVHYPASFIVQKWNDVLAVLKTSNRFKAYQWLKNGEELYGATRSFLYETPTLDFTAMYSMRFTREDNAVLFTCPLTPQARDEDPAAYPTIVDAAAAMTITAAHAGEAVIRNTQGTVMSRQMFGSGVSNITVPTTTGLYFVELQTNEEAPRIIKIVVR